MPPFVRPHQHDHPDCPACQQRRCRQAALQSPAATPDPAPKKCEPAAKSALESRKVAVITVDARAEPICQSTCVGNMASTPAFKRLKNLQLGRHDAHDIV